MGKNEALVESLIPRALHQVWIGPRDEPGYIVEWEGMAQEAGWDHIFWGENEIADLEFPPGLAKLYTEYYLEGCYNGACNVARVAILLQYGGVYLDADIQAIEWFGSAWWHKTPTGMWISESPHKRKRPQNAAMACVKRHSVIQEYADALGGVVTRHPSWQKSGSGLLQPILERYSSSYQMIPSYAFHPTDMHGKPTPGLQDYEERGGKVYGCHNFYTTNRKKFVK